MKKNAEVIIECLILAASFVFVIFFIRVYFPFPHTRVGATKTNIVGIYPNPIFTPGVTNPDITQANINQTICNPKWSTKSIRPPVSYTNKLKIQQIKEYGYQDTDPSHFEEDHEVALTDAGSPTDAKNLWPMPYPIAYEKDKYEVYVHNQICSGQITLIEGQNRLKTDWYKWYLESGLNKNLGSINSLDTDDE